MRKVYQGNGFIVETNDCGEIFVRRDKEGSTDLRISPGHSSNDITISYLNSDFVMEPLDRKTITFRK